jgi:hypothetical protein
MPVQQGWQHAWHLMSGFNAHDISTGDAHLNGLLRDTLPTQVYCDALCLTYERVDPGLIGHQLPQMPAHIKMLEQQLIFGTAACLVHGVMTVQDLCRLLTMVASGIMSSIAGMLPR